ncbi:WD40-repeat-containing domain protein, partial [Lanmaoa asiatica]
STEDGPSRPMQIDVQDPVRSVACLVDGKHIVSGGDGGKIRRWRMEDGKEVGTPIDAGSDVLNIAVSRDGNWVVCGMDSGKMTVLNVESHEKVTKLNGHSDDWVRAVDVSPDGTRIAAGSDDETVCVWSLATGQRLLGPLRHDSYVAAVKFSPDGRLIVTATWKRDCVRIYDSQNGGLIVDFPIQVSSFGNQCLAWTSDSELLFILSCGGIIKCLDVPIGMTLSQWSLSSTSTPGCIALASNETFIAVSDSSLVSFWDTTTHKQIGHVIEHTDRVVSMAISTKHDLAMGGGKTISLRSLCDII